MAKNANQNLEEVDEVPPIADVPIDVPVPVLAAVLGAVPAGPSARRSLGVKEPIIFKWKIIGLSEGMFLTLFKSVEREEVDSQLERLQKEGYYRDLRILEANEKVEQPPMKNRKKIPVRAEAPVKPAPPPPSPRAAESAKKPAAAPSMKPSAALSAKPSAAPSAKPSPVASTKPSTAPSSKRAVPVKPVKPKAPVKPAPKRKPAAATKRASKAR